MKILLIDDDENFSSLIVALLTPEFELICCESLAGAAKIIEKEKDSLDLVLLDLNLPNGRGIATIRKAREITKDLPIIVLTGDEEPGMARNAISEGAEDFLFKMEVVKGKLTEIVHRVFDKFERKKRIEHGLSKLATTEPTGMSDANDDATKER